MADNESSFGIHQLFLNHELAATESDASFLSKFKKRISVIKGIGISIMIIVACIAPGLVVLGSTPKYFDHQDHIKMNDIHFNFTARNFMKQFYLQQSIYLTVCIRDDFVILDIRRFFNQSASILGIPLNTRQWFRLKQLTHAIDAAISHVQNAKKLI